ncbi:MAG TPA: tetratricopeptide repeat protein [Methylomirabilota bacterium]|nr:tetratricopeptide repeat protein [Methylomirabilota bacterium]
MEQTAPAPQSGIETEPPARPRGAFLLLGGLLIFCFFCAFFRVSDVDVGYHIRTGEHILARHGIPAVNTFSYTVPNEPWYLQQALPATFFSWLHRIGGVPALSTFKAFLATLAMLLVWCAARNAAGKNSIWPFWLVTIAVLITRVRFYERPDLLTSALFALAIVLDQRFGKNRRWQLIFLPLFMAMWANMHAGYIYGFVLLAVFAGVEWLEFFFPKLRAVGEPPAPRPPFKQLLTRPLSILLSVIAALVSVQLISPNGWKVLTVPFTQFLSPFWKSIIIELFPPTWADSKLLFLWMGALVLLQVLTWRHFRLRYFVITVAFGYFACSSQRSLTVFVIASAAHAAYMLSKLRRVNFALLPRLSRPLLPVSWAALLAFVIVPDQTYQFGLGLYHPYYPTEIFQFVKREVPPQNLFNDMRFGGPMLWKLYPDFKPFVDGRGDAYTEEFWKTEYLPAVEGKESWAETFQKYHVTGALLSIPAPNKIPRLARTLFEHPDWALVAFNDETLLFLKKTDANRAVIERHAFKQLWPGNWDLGQINTTNLPGMVAEAARAFELHPGDYAHAIAARCAMVAGNFDDASDLFAFLVERPGTSESFWRDYAFCLYQSQRYAKAERVLAQMIEKKLAVGFAYYLQHFIALQNQNPAGAKAFLTKAIAAEPDNRAYREAWQRFQQASTSGESTPSRVINKT